MGIAARKVPDVGLRNGSEPVTPQNSSRLGITLALRSSSLSFGSSQRALIRSRTAAGTSPKRVSKMSGEDRLLATFLAGESFKAGNVGHGIGVLESINLFSQRDNKLVGQRHQPVDQRNRCHLNEAAERVVQQPPG